MWQARGGWNECRRDGTELLKALAATRRARQAAPNDSGQIQPCPTAPLPFLGAEETLGMHGM